MISFGTADATVVGAVVDPTGPPLWLTIDMIGDLITKSFIIRNVVAAVTVFVLDVSDPCYCRESTEPTLNPAAERK